MATGVSADPGVVRRLNLDLFAVVANWLFGCSHRKTTFPVTIPAGACANGRPATAAETYVVCLACGRHISYDWTTMRIVEQRAFRTEDSEGSH